MLWAWLPPSSPLAIYVWSAPQLEQCGRAFNATENDPRTSMFKCRRHMVANGVNFSMCDSSMFPKRKQCLGFRIYTKALLVPWRRGAIRPETEEIAPYSANGTRSHSVRVGLYAVRTRLVAVAVECFRLRNDGWLFHSQPASHLQTRLIETGYGPIRVETRVKSGKRYRRIKIHYFKNIAFPAFFVISFHLRRTA